jgi:rSAM/selenodomain-associated transferase 1
VRSPRSAGVLVVFAKEPLAGLVKTRMCPPLSPEQAAALYARMLDDVLEVSAGAARALGLEAVLAVHPAPARREMARRAPSAFRIVAQRGRDLGERMGFAAAEAAAGGATAVLLRGSDSPALGRESLRSALAALDSCDLAVCPDLDGGYSLIAMRRPLAGVFDHAMSTGTVMQDTLRNASRLGLQTRVLDACFDIDTIADLAELRRRRTAGNASMCRNTVAYLDAHDLWRLAGPP